MATTPKIPNQYLVIGEVILILGLLGLLGYFIHGFLKSHKEKQELHGEEELAGNDNLKKEGLEKVVKKVPVNISKKVQDALHKFDPKPIADMIYDAKGTFNDDEDAVYSAFAMIKSQAELSLLSLYFEGLYKKQLFSFIQNFLDASEMNKINDLVKKLPVY